MSYSVYIKKDYKPVIVWQPDEPWYQRPRTWLLGLAGAGSVFLIHAIIASSPNLSERETSASINNTVSSTIKADKVFGAEPTGDEPRMEALADMEQIATLPEDNAALTQWQTVKVMKGDNLSLIFDRMGIVPSVLHEVLAADTEAKALKHLLPDQELRFLFDKNQFSGLEYDLDINRTLQVGKKDDAFISEIITTPLSIETREASATIDSSLFLAGQNAGLSDNLIMQLAAIYGWDIDFALDIRSGDRFKVIYEERYKEGVKVSEGPILAAVFTNKEKSYRTVRYTSPDGNTDYYSETGANMRKAFLRTPLKFTRISSLFTLNRRHPVLNTIRAHKGVDYAAPIGTPIKATSDGTVVHLGPKGGYGKAIILKHGSTYSTLYGHMSRYAAKLKYGSQVEQGQIIGYVGMSGLATGPHLHYEFRVNDVHRNPLTVELPKAGAIPERLMADFKLKTSPMLAQLDEDQYDNKKKIVLASRETDTAPSSSSIPENY